MLAAGTAYLRVVGPTYGFFGLGLALYFASQGAGRLLWPLLAGTLRMLVAIGGGWLLLRSTGALHWLFAALALGLIVYGAGVFASVVSGSWFPGPKPRVVPAPAERLDTVGDAGC
jgi:Na+-driven multidrug efflux pump